MYKEEMFVICYFLLCVQFGWCENMWSCVFVKKINETFVCSVWWIQCALLKFVIYFNALNIVKIEDERNCVDINFSGQM